MSLREEAIAVRKWFVHEIHNWNPYSSSDPMSRHVYENLTEIIYEGMLFTSYADLQIQYGLEPENKHSMRDLLPYMDLFLLMQGEIYATDLLAERKPTSHPEMQDICREACTIYWDYVISKIPS